MMTPEEFEAKMREIDAIGDEEIKHSKADDLMCEVLESLGYGAGVRIFCDMDKWYS